MEQIQYIAMNLRHSCIKRVNIVIDGISGIFLPFVNHLSACGILTGLLTLSVTAGLLTTQENTYQIFQAMTSSLFYFLPMLLAFTAAHKFQTNSFTAVIIAGVLLFPNLTTVLESGHTMKFIGLTIYPVTYHSSVIPILMAIGVLRYVERFCHRFVPVIIRDFITPMIALVIVSVLTLTVLGPVGVKIGNMLAVTYQSIYSSSPIMAGIILGGLIQLMVIFGFHWSLIPVAINNIAIHGSDTILALMGPAVFAQAGAAFAVSFRAKDKKYRIRCISAAISALFGITEPATYGVNLPLKKPMIGVCLGGAVGGGIAGIYGAKAISFAFPGLITLPVFVGSGFIGFLIAIAAGFLVGFAYTICSTLNITSSIDDNL